MVALGPITSWNPGHGPVTTWTASPASRAAMAQAGVDALPATFQQANHLRSAYYGRLFGREMPRLIVVAWEIPGVCDIARMTDAINIHMRRHDTYHSSFDVQDGAIVRRTIESPELIDFTATSVGELDEEQIREHVMATTPGTLEWDCFSFGIIQKADHFTFYASIDHLHGDGMSTGLIFLDINLAYDCLTHGRPVTLGEISGYRDFSLRQQEKIAAMTAESAEIRDWISFARDTEGAWPSFPLPLGDTHASSAGTFVTVDLMDATQTEAFDTACRAAGARFSGGVLACAGLAEHRLTGTQTYHGFTPSDTRTPGADAMSVGWFASLFPVTVPVADGDFASAARAAQASFDTSKHLSAVPFERVLELGSIDELGIKLPTKSSMMVSYMDFRKIPCGELWEQANFGAYGDNLSHGGINVWINRHADRTTITVSLPDNAEARESVQRYISVVGEVFTDAARTTQNWIEQVSVHANSTLARTGSR